MYQNGFIAGANSILRRKVITGLEVEGVLRQLEDWVSHRREEAIPKDKILLEISELRERLCPPTEIMAQNEVLDLGEKTTTNI